MPLSRLVARDIAQQPGALTALIILIIVVVIIAINQVRVIRKTGHLPKYLTLYIVGGTIIGLLAAVPDEALRLHHYIIGLILLPATAFPTRLSLIYCNFLLGIFLNGVSESSTAISFSCSLPTASLLLLCALAHPHCLSQPFLIAARWGYDGILQDVAVVRGDATAGTGLPTFLTSSQTWTGISSSNSSSATTNTSTSTGAGTGNGTVSWDPIPSDLSGEWDSFALLVDDVLRYSGSGTSFDLSTLPNFYSPSSSSSSSQSSNAAANAAADQGTFAPGSNLSDPATLNSTIANEPHYLRLAYTTNGSPGDFTMAAKAWWNGTWFDPAPGAT